ncbi:Pro-kumamolisin, activation domain-containing protein [Mycena capillaripes]|nr:Pro-kumamolisin, activation domain-containing protein [Mycena capillaripes]
MAYTIIGIDDKYKGSSLGHYRLTSTSSEQHTHCFAKVGPAADSAPVNLRISLPSSDIAGLEKTLLDVSTPFSSNYGNHLTKAKVNACLAPPAEAVAAVEAWLAFHDLVATPSSSAGDWLSVPVFKANELLAAKSETFKHLASSKIQTYARTLSYSLPAEVVEHIHPTIIFNSPVSVKPVISVPQPAAAVEVSEDVSSNATPSSCANSITTTCLQSLYKIPTTTVTESSNSIAVAGFLDEFAQKADLKNIPQDLPHRYLLEHHLQHPDTRRRQRFRTPRMLNLDIQYTVGVATGVTAFFVSVGNDCEDGDLGGFLDIINFLSSEDTVPQVLTTSYGDSEAAISKPHAFKLCNAYAAFGARSSSVLFASGDGGVEGPQPRSCTKHQATFPSGCPFLTSVGSVHGIAPETASTFCSGGLSNYWGSNSLHIYASLLSSLGFAIESDTQIV